jgi:hypothetical protein
MSTMPIRWLAPIPRARALAAGLVLAAALMIYLSSIRAPFFADDYLFLDQARGKSLPAVLAEPDPIGNFYRPVGRQLYFWTMARALGERPAMFHAFGLFAFLACAGLLFAVARALADARAATIAAAFFVVHYAAEVPVRWASGSQDLLAVAGALAAVLLHVRGRSLLAALPLLAALFSKETVLFAPAIAVVAGRRPGESWVHAARRAWPLFAAALAWALVWLARSRRALAGSGVSFDPVGALGAFAHLAQVFVGWEWRQADFARWSVDWPSLAATVLVVAAVAIALPTRREGRRSAAGAPRTLATPADARRAWRVGIAWALLATIPIAAVASIWSAYYYLFAMCGAALALGAWASRRRPGLALAALALLGAGSAVGRSLEDFSVLPTPWTGQSHINRFYIERATRQSGRYLASLKRQRPTLPESTTVFFAGLRGNVGFQTADGPLLRWAYRDPTLHSYYVHQFSRHRAGTGPVLLVDVDGDSLKEATAGRGTFGAMAFSLALSERLAGARDALAMLRERGHPDPLSAYFEGWLAWSAGDTAEAKRVFEPGGIRMDAGPTPEIATARAVLAAGDTLGAREIMSVAVTTRGRDPHAHGLFADLVLMTEPRALAALIESLAARTLAPEDPLAWRRFGVVQLHHKRHQEALVTFERYFRLAGPAGEQDAQARQWVATIRRAMPGGGQPQSWLHE